MFYLSLLGMPPHPSLPPAPAISKLLPFLWAYHQRIYSAVISTKRLRLVETFEKNW